MWKGWEVMAFKTMMLFKVFIIPCWMSPNLFLCRTLNLPLFCLPTQPKLEFPANNNYTPHSDLVPFFFHFGSNHFYNMWSGSWVQSRLSNPVVHVVCGWQRQAIWKGSEAAGNYLRDKAHTNPHRYIFLLYPLQLPSSLLGLPCLYRDAWGTGLLEAQICGFNSEIKEHCGFNWEELYMTGNCKCYGFPAGLQPSLWVYSCDTSCESLCWI